MTVSIMQVSDLDLPLLEAGIPLGSMPSPLPPTHARKQNNGYRADKSTPRRVKRAKTDLTVDLAAIGFPARKATPALLTQLADAILAEADARTAAFQTEWGLDRNPANCHDCPIFRLGFNSCDNEGGSFFSDVEDSYPSEPTHILRPEDVGYRTGRRVGRSYLDPDLLDPHEVLDLGCDHPEIHSKTWV